jgi:MlaD protein
LIPGLVVTGTLLAIAGAVLTFARIGAVHGPRIRLYLATSAAHGVIPGTDVWLDGEHVGRVAWLRFRPPTTDPAGRLLIALDITASVQPFLRRDVHAEIRAGSSLIGAPVVYLSGGSPAASAIAEADTLATTPQHELDGARAQIASAARDLPVILDNFESVRTQLFSGTGTIGAFSSEAGAERFEVLGDAAGRLSAHISDRRGSAAQLARNDLADRARVALAAADTIRRRASAGPFGRLGGDSALVRDVRDVRAELATVRALLAAPPSGSTTADTTVGGAVGGALGGAHRPPRSEVVTLRRQLGDADAELHRLLADIGHRPLRYIIFY